MALDPDSPMDGLVLSPLMKKDNCRVMIEEIVAHKLLFQLCPKRYIFSRVHVTPSDVMSVRRSVGWFVGWFVGWSVCYIYGTKSIN